MPEALPNPDDRTEQPQSQEGETPDSCFDTENTAASPVTTQSLLMAMAHSESRKYVSPLPAPVDLERMERLLPGSFERLLHMAEQDAKTTRENETKIVEASIADRRDEREQSSRGQNYGLIVAIIGLALAGIAIAMGHPVAATFLGFTPLVTLVGIFVMGENPKNEPKKDGKDAD